MGRPKKTDNRVSINRRLPRHLWARVQAFADSRSPRCTDTAVMEAALIEYLDRRESKPKKGEK